MQAGSRRPLFPFALLYAPTPRPSRQAPAAAVPSSSPLRPGRPRCRDRAERYKNKQCGGAGSGWNLGAFAESDMARPMHSLFSREDRAAAACGRGRAPRGQPQCLTGAGGRGGCMRLRVRGARRVRAAALRGPPWSPSPSPSPSPPRPPLPPPLPAGTARPAAIAASPRQDPCCPRSFRRRLRRAATAAREPSPARASYP